MNFTVRVLAKDDDKEGFFCTDTELDTFFKKFAGQNQFKHYIGTTYIASLNDNIVGFITVNASSIRVKELKNQDIKKLPNYPLPILRISRFAVDVKYQNMSIGKELLKSILNLSVEQRDRFGCIGVVVDAKENSVSFYEQFDFESIDIVQGQLDIRPYPRSMFLSMSVILKVKKYT